MASRLDLHVHTTASDGTLTPEEAVQEAEARGMHLLGITDHDTTGGIQRAQVIARSCNVTVIPGVELSVGDGSTEIHVLGYFVDVEGAALQEKLTWMQEEREHRNERIIARLHELGLPIEMTRVKELAGKGLVGRPHIAAVLMEHGFVDSIGEAFRKYLARGKSGYIGRERLSPREAAEAIKKAGGIPTLAHPGKLGSRAAIEALLEEGIEGIEVYHSDHVEKDISILLKIAKENDLLITGGTDSHGPKGDRPIAIGELAIPDWVAEQVLAHAPEGWRAR